MIRVIHQRTNLPKSSLSSECMNSIKARFKKKTPWPTMNSFPFPFLVARLHYSFIHSTNIYRAKQGAENLDSKETDAPAHSATQRPRRRQKDDSTQNSDLTEERPERPNVERDNVIGNSAWFPGCLLNQQLIAARAFTGGKWI